MKVQKNCTYPYILFKTIDFDKKNGQGQRETKQTSNINHSSNKIGNTQTSYLKTYLCFYVTEKY